MAEADLKEKLESIDVSKPVMRTQWWLIGVPYDKVGLVQSHVAAMEGVAEITVRKSTV
jgi:hypothetical protein